MNIEQYKYRYHFINTTRTLSHEQFNALVYHTGYIYYQLLTGKTEYIVDDTGVIGSKYGAFKWNEGFDVLYLHEEDILILASNEYYLWLDELIDELGIDWNNIEIYSINNETTS